ncbi:MAG: TonB-dependent receptor [Bryobacteraceae bacterium]
MRTPAALCLFVLMCSAGAYAQAIAGFGAITGKVRDIYGDGIPDTTVTITNRALGLRLVLTTTDDGVFYAPALAPAAGYAVKVTRKGFTGWNAADLKVPVGETVNFHITLQQTAPGAKAQTAVAPGVQDTKSGITDLISRDAIEDLPLSARRVESLVAEAPLAALGGTPDTIGFRGSPSSDIAVVDGLDASDGYFLNKADPLRAFPVEAVDSVQVIASTPPLEYKATGGIANAATRTGTEDFHGEVYAFYRNASFASPDRYDPAFRPADKQEMEGGNVGGQALDRLYFFVGLEALSGDSQGINRITNPLIADPYSIAVLPSRCGAPATSVQCTAADKFIQAQMNAIIPRSQKTFTGLARADYHWTERNSFSLMADAQHYRAPNGYRQLAVSPDGGLLGGNGNVGEETRFADAGWTSQQGSSIVNELRLGWYKDRISVLPETQQWPSTGALGITVAGVSLGGNPGAPGVVPDEQRYQIAENFTVTSGANILRLGAEGGRGEDQAHQVYNQQGTYNYPSLTAFAQDFSSNKTNSKDYTLFTQQFGNPIRSLGTKWVGVYGQDDWKISRRMQVEFGLRWDKVKLPQPDDYSTSFYETEYISSPNMTLQPRGGISYLWNDRTVIRAGFGMYYTPFPMQLIDALFLGNGLYQTSISVNPYQSGALVFPKVSATGTTIPNATSNIAFANSKFRNENQQIGTFSIERSLGKNTTVTISYVNGRGLHLWTAEDLNLNISSINRTYTVDNAAGAAVNTVIMPMWNSKTSSYFGQVYNIINDGASWYTAGVAQFRKRMWHGLTLDGSYTWSQNLDTQSGPLIFGSVPLSSYNGAYISDKGKSNLNQTERGVVELVWQPMLTRSTSSLARFVLNGWQFSGIATIATGLPETALVQVLGQQFTGVTMVYTNSMTGTGGWNRMPLDQINSLSTGDSHPVNARLSRSLPFTDKIRGELMFEAFNALNSQFNTSVNNIAYTAQSGVLRPVPGAGVGNASWGPMDGTNARRMQVAFKLMF